MRSILSSGVIKLFNRISGEVWVTSVDGEHFSGRIAARLVLGKPRLAFALQTGGPCLLTRRLGQSSLRVDHLEQGLLVDPTAMPVLPFLPRPTTFPKRYPRVAQIPIPSRDHAAIIDENPDLRQVPRVVLHLHLAAAPSDQRREGITPVVHPKESDPSAPELAQLKRQEACPEGFDIDRHLAQEEFELADGPEIAVKIALDEVATWLLERRRRGTGSLTVNDDGTGLLEVAVRSEEGLFRWLAELGARAHIVEPKRLAVAFAERVAATRSLYEDEAAA